MGHSIFNPINDISNIFEGTVHLFTNPAQQINKYILPAVKSGLGVAAVAAATFIPGGQVFLPEAIGFAAGTYGTQIATKGLGNLTSGGTPSIGDFAAGLGVAGGVAGITALGTGGIAGGTSAFMSGLGQVGSDITGGIGGIGQALGIGGGSTVATTAGAAAAPSLLSSIGGDLLSAAPYIALGGLTLYSSSKQAAAQKAAMQQMQSEISQNQQSQACGTVLNLSPNELMGTQWSQVLPQLSPSCSSQISSQIPNKLTDVDLAEMMYYSAIGTINTADVNALFAILPSNLVSQAKSLYSSCLGSQTPSQISASTTAAQEFVNCLNGTSSAAAANTAANTSPGYMPALSALGGSSAASVSPSYSYQGVYPATNVTQFYSSPQVASYPSSAYYAGTNVAQFSAAPTSTIPAYTAPAANEAGSNVKSFTSTPQNYTGANWLVYQTQQGFNDILSPLKAL